jgi:transcriptional adapter 2-alpha
MKRKIEITPDEFHSRKRRRIAEMDSALPPLPVSAPQAIPANHEVAGFMPGRLEFEHEPDNEAEHTIMDLTFGTCHEFGGNDIPEDETDPDLRARQRWIDDHMLGPDGLPYNSSTYAAMGMKSTGGKGKTVASSNGHGTNGVNGINGRARDKRSKEEDGDGEDGEDKPDEADEETEPMPMESEESLAFKLTLIEAYSQRMQRRDEIRQLIFDRNLVDFKKVRVPIILS